MDALVPLMKSHPGPSVLLFSFIFRVIHKLLQRLPVPKVVKQDEVKSWKWRNLSVSIVHSLLTGPWALLCVAIWPEIPTNFNHYSHLSYLLICVSTGYFVQDAGDIILSGHGRMSWEFLLHHALVISCFLCVLYTGLYLGGAVMTLFVEINSVTLHLRLLLKLASAESSSMYYINKHINIISYVPSRLGTQAYLTWYLIHNHALLDHGLYFLICLIVMDIMILIYFFRLIRTDFLSSTKRSYVGQNGAHHSNSKKFPSD